MLLADRLAGCLLGTAVGDALCLPGEGLSRRRIARRWPGPLRHRLLFGGGMLSDDSEHALFVAQALIAHGDDPARFQRALAVKLRLWLLGLPAGIGAATLRACLRLWCGVAPGRSGVASAGNGAAMRSAVIGVAFAADAARRRAFVDASTAITHRDPRAVIAARAVAEAAAWSVRDETADALWSALRAAGDDPAWTPIVERLRLLLIAGADVDDCAVALDGAAAVDGYAWRSVPLALYAWRRHHGDFAATMAAIWRCGGDVDTTAAIAGALAGAELGEAVIPPAWIAGIRDWPRSPALLRRVARRLAGEGPRRPVGYCWPALIPRNLLFLATVVAHGFRRKLPPW